MPGNCLAQSCMQVHCITGLESWKEPIKRDSTSPVLNGYLSKTAKGVRICKTLVSDFAYGLDSMGKARYNFNRTKIPSTD